MTSSWYSNNGYYSEKTSLKYILLEATSGQLVTTPNS